MYIVHCCCQFPQLSYFSLYLHTPPHTLLSTLYPSRMINQTTYNIFYFHCMLLCQSNVDLSLYYEKKGKTTFLFAIWGLQNDWQKSQAFRRSYDCWCYLVVLCFKSLMIDKYKMNISWKLTDLKYIMQNIKHNPFVKGHFLIQDERCFYFHTFLSSFSNPFIYLNTLSTRIPFVPTTNVQITITSPIKGLTKQIQFKKGYFFFLFSLQRSLSQH